MRLFCCLLFVMCTHVLGAQHENAWRYDTTAAKLRKKQKVQASYMVREEYSMAGVIEPGAVKDTMGYEYYDREGRTVFRFVRDAATENHQRYWYDAQGRVIRAIFYALDSSNAEYSEYHYDDRGNMVQETGYHYTEGKSRQSYLGTYQFDERDRLLVYMDFFTGDSGSPALTRTDRYWYPGKKIVHQLHDNRAHGYVQQDTTYLRKGSSLKVIYSCSLDPETSEFILSGPTDSIRSDTLKVKGNTVYVREWTGYDPELQAIVLFAYDSTIADAQGRTVEHYYENRIYSSVDKFTYSKTGELIMNSYTAALTPNYRITESRTYYQ